MIAVLVDARRPGSSSWVSTRACDRAQVSGLHGGEVVLTIEGEDGRTNLRVSKDQIVELHPSVVRVMARVVRVTELSRINIDLMNGRRDG